MNIHLATDPAHIKRCAPVLRELRTFLTEDQIIDRVQQQMTDGYRLAYIEAADIVASVAGYRILRNLIYGRFLYVDDLVTRADHKRAGYAGQLLEWLCEHTPATKVPHSSSWTPVSNVSKPTASI
jgi:GNAT superfamily N-acetyltransferase